MKRRTVLIAAAPLGLVGLAGCSAAEVQRFPSIASAIKAIEALDPGVATSGGWSLSQVLQHAAQSIEFSLRGFPQAKSAVFQATVGSAAFAVFQARGRMNHGLDEPIPGAPALDATLPLRAAMERAVAAWREFDAHGGTLAPHFAYGALDKAAYTRAHLMHLANHWTELTLTRTTA
jgi:Protein of unknown function (DUF1569)